MSVVQDSMRTLRPLIGISRPSFLLLPITLVAVGASVAASAGTVDLFRTAVALIGLLSLHISVNALNEAADYESGIDRQTNPTPFSGGSKTLPQTQLTPQTAYRFGYLTAGIGAVIGVWFLWVVGLVLLPVIVIGAITVLFYTDYLTKYSLGEVAAGAGLGGLPVIGTALVQNGQLSIAAIAASVPAFFLTFDLLLLNEFPDFDPDRAGGRANLLHRLGRPTAGRLYVLATLLVPISIALSVAGGLFPLWTLLGVVPVVVAIRPIQWTLTSPTERPPVAVLRNNVLFILSTNTLLAVGFLVELI